jgi:hypothetical protein
MSEQTKDPIISTKSTTLGESSKGANRLTISLPQEQVQALIQELGKLLENPRGVKLDIHTAKRSGPRGEFLSSFMFVKGIQEFGAVTSNTTAKKGAYKPTTGPSAKQVVG